MTALMFLIPASNLGRIDVVSLRSFCAVRFVSSAAPLAVISAGVMGVGIATARLTSRLSELMNNPTNVLRSPMLLAISARGIVGLYADIPVYGLLVNPALRRDTIS
jgi:hypothetical protein